MTEKTLRGFASPKMADKRKEYTVEINGIEHSMLLEPEDAERLYGENAKEAKASNKARTADNKGA